MHSASPLYFNQRSTHSEKKSIFVFNKFENRINKETCRRQAKTKFPERSLKKIIDIFYKCKSGLRGNTAYRPARGAQKTLVLLVEIRTFDYSINKKAS